MDKNTFKNNALIKYMKFNEIRRNYEFFLKSLVKIIFFSVYQGDESKNWYRLQEVQYNFVDPKQEVILFRLSLKW